MKPLVAILLAIAAIAGALALISGNSPESSPLAAVESPAQAAAAPSIVLYSGRSKSLVDPIIERFTKETGIEVRVKYGNTPQLVQALEAEGRRSPADVFWAQDAGGMESLAKAGMFAPLPKSLFAHVADNFKTSDLSWIATSGRARVLAYSPIRVKAEELPKSIFDLTDPKWKGRIGWAPGNASFQAFVTAMRAEFGEEKTTAWLKGMIANEPRVYPKNTPIVSALAAGDIDLGLPNHYYLLGMKKEKPDLPVAQTFFKDGDIGNLVFVSGAAILKTSSNQANAQKFVAFMLKDSSQTFFTSEVNEYPVTNTVKPASTLMNLSDLHKAAPKVKLEQLQDLPGTLKLLKELGLL